MLADAQYFDSRISKLEGAGDVGSHIVEVVKNKTIAAETQQSQSAMSEDRVTSSKEDIETPAAVNGEQEKT